jgi:transaldolase
LHWSELIGGDVILTIPPEWQRKFNASTIPVRPRIDEPVPAQALTELSEQFEDFRRAFDPKGMKVSEFDNFGATRRTLRAFLDSYYGLLSFIRDLRIPNPDK